MDHGTLNNGLWDYEILDHGSFGPYDYMAKVKTFAFEKTLLGQFVIL